MLNILVIHGYVQTAATVAANTVQLRDALANVATLHYVDGPPMPLHSRSAGRPWWILDGNLELNSKDNRWQDTISWWSSELSENQYDGVIGLSQGSAMTALLVSMLNRPARVLGFSPTKIQPFKFAIFCSGFVSHSSPHGELYDIPNYLPTLHTVDDHDMIVPASRTRELQRICQNAQLRRHNEGHTIPVHGEWPEVFRDFIIEAVKKQRGKGLGKGLLVQEAA